MRLLVCLALFLVGCSGAGLPKEWVSAHESLRKVAIPNTVALYRKVNERMGKDLPAEKRIGEAKEMQTALNIQIAELERLLAALNVPDTKISYIIANQDEIKSMLAEARAYKAYLELMQQPGPAGVDEARKALAQASAARAQVSAHTQYEYDRNVGISSGLSRPQVIDLGR